MRGHHRVLFSGGVQVLFDTVHGIHGILEGADEQTTNLAPILLLGICKTLIL